MKVFFLLLFLGLISSCAKPNYVGDTASKIESISAERGCLLYFSQENLCLHTEWITKPSESHFGEMVITFSDKDDPDRIISPRHEPFILLWMPSMGHGSSPVTLQRTAEGKYLASEIFFIMPGPWDIRYQLKVGEDVLEEVIQKITI